ncbi:hypothetical protein PVAP13_1KG374505 [Panicum virgatum]|uniref:ATP-dependent DNA helicase n=1 Tax=Panicum virgatum TaxID=38727 RepID=A0A8T0XWG2_PANVG|nr:hypothetical protein PVAP13_1KG374505 [Panicum virgatum]
MPICEYCSAIRQGKVNIVNTPIPPDLCRLFTSQSDRDVLYFRKNIRYFNSHFSFTSFGSNVDHQVATAAGTGIYNFKVHGQIYHRLDQLRPGKNAPRHMQLYFYDTVGTLSHRSKRSVGQMKNLDELKIELNTSISIDQRRYNAPAMDQVVAICSPYPISRWWDWLGRQEYIARGNTYFSISLLKTDALKANSQATYRSAQDLCEEQDDCDDNMEDDGEGGKLYINTVSWMPFLKSVCWLIINYIIIYYYCSCLKNRRSTIAVFNIFFYGGKLFQQWIVDIYVKIESMLLDWYSNPEHLKIIRGIMDTLAAGEHRGLKAGKLVVLSKNFFGSDRDVQCRFMDAMSLVTKYGKPYYFITMTCNPYWLEIIELLLPGQTPQDRVDIVARVYHAKLIDFHDFIIKKGYFGKQNYRMKKKYPLLHELVCKHMMHGPCGVLNRNCGCMQDGACSFRYPKQFIHLSGMHMVPFNDDDNLEDVLEHARNQRSMLTEFFRMNSEDPNARGYLYRESYQIGRLVYAYPSEGERFYLRVLLNYVRDPTSFISIRTVRGVMSPTFRECCEKLGLVKIDSTLDNALSEFVAFQMPCAIKRMFATIMVFCEYTNIHALWDKHFESMAEDYQCVHGNSSSVEQFVLRDIADILFSMGKDIRNYGLPIMHQTGETNRDYYRELTEEKKIVISNENIKLAESLNTEQMEGFNEIFDHVIRNKGKTGKTYLYRALLARVRSTYRIAISKATSGIAASIMPGGRTAHSWFKIPIKLEDNSVCNLTKQSGTSALLREASLIIWDEVAMTRRQAVETLDRSLRDITGSDLPFGGKIIVFGGDFKQVLPVVPRGTRAQICDATLLRFYVWNDIKIIRLKQNMRALNDVWFSQFLLRIGDGTEKIFTNDYVNLPDDIMLEYNNDQSIILSSVIYMSEHVILSTRNEYVNSLNALMIAKFSGKEKIYYSHDSVDDDSTNNYPLDFLNSITPNGLPPHEFKIKKNCPIMILRNLDPRNRLCNGTRLVFLYQGYPYLHWRIFHYLSSSRENNFQ